MKLHTLALAFASAALLSGCLVPEKFTATATVQPDASVHYQYTGTAVHAMVLLQKRDGGKLSAKEEQELRDLGKKSGSAGSTFNYLGDGRYQVKVNATLTTAKPKSDMQVFNYTKQGSNYRIAAVTGDPADLEELAKAGFAPDGVFEVTLPKGAKVIEHNATSTPGFFSKSYKWKVKRLDSPVAITFSL